MQAFPVVTFSSLSPLTTKGDLLGYSTASLRVGVGLDGQHIVADANQAAGIKWATPVSFTAFV